jgi:hypothetical protein
MYLSVGIGCGGTDVCGRPRVLNQVQDDVGARQDDVGAVTPAAGRVWSAMR